MIRTEIIIRMQPDSDRSRQKALKVAATVAGVESVSVAGRDRDLLLVIGDGVDTSRLTKKLRKEVGAAEIVELRTLDGGAASSTAAAAALLLPAAARASKDAVAAAAAQARSPYQWHQNPTPGRSLLGDGGERVAYQVASSPLAAASPGPARWPDEHMGAATAAGWPAEHMQAAGYYASAPSPQHYYYPSPAAAPAGHGGYGHGYGSSYARAAARSHPANYSPMIERHDGHRVPGRSRKAERRHSHAHGHGSGEPNCCSIL